MVSPPPPLIKIAEAAIGHGAVQKPTELAEFLSLVADLKPEVIVEIGVFAGGTLYAWKRLAPTVIGIDYFPGGPYPVYLSHGKPRDEHGATVIVGDSHYLPTWIALVEELGGRPVDVLFIDGDHTYEGVRQDYEMYAPLVRPGGLVAFHDIVTHPGQICDVERLWYEIRDDTAIEISVVSDPPWGGIGVLRV